MSIYSMKFYKNDCLTYYNSPLAISYFSFVTYAEKVFSSFIFRHFISTQMLAGLLSGCAPRQLNSRCHVYKYPTI